MNERTMLAETAARLLRDIASTPTLAFAAAWQRAVDLGLPLLMVEEAAGGFGGSWTDLSIVQWEAGRHASALPLGECILAQHLCARAGMSMRDGFGTVAFDLRGTCDGANFTGVARNVPAGRHAQWLVGIVEGSLLRIDTKNGVVSEKHNLAGEARDTLTFESAPYERIQFDSLGWPPLECGALLRLGQIAGALTAALTLTTEYVTRRVQFGKPIGSFQSVQQQLAAFAIEAAAAGCAARAACAAADRTATPQAAGYAIAAAKLRANLAIGVATATAHQLHGAIGFTQEYPLHPLTRRLWAWRTEAGNDQYWSSRLGAHVASRGPDCAWADIVAA